MPRTALAVAASDREGRIKLLTATGFTPDQHLYTTIDHVLYPTITNFKTLQAYLHSNRPFPTIQTTIDYIMVAELGSLSSGAKMAMKIFVKRVFTIFASNASFLRVIANLQN